MPRGQIIPFCMATECEHTHIRETSGAVLRSSMDQLALQMTSESPQPPCVCAHTPAMGCVCACVTPKRAEVRGCAHQYNTEGGSS